MSVAAIAAAIGALSFDFEPGAMVDEPVFASQYKDVSGSTRDSLRFVSLVDAYGFDVGVPCLGQSFGPPDCSPVQFYTQACQSVTIGTACPAGTWCWLKATNTSSSQAQATCSLTTSVAWPTDTLGYVGIIGTGTRAGTREVGPP